MVHLAVVYSTTTLWKKFVRFLSKNRSIKFLYDFRTIWPYDFCVIYCNTSHKNRMVKLYGNRIKTINHTKIVWSNCTEIVKNTTKILYLSILFLSYFYMIAVQNLFNLHRLIQTKSNATNYTKIIWLKIVCL